MNSPLASVVADRPQSLSSNRADRRRLRPGVTELIATEAKRPAVSVPSVIAPRPILATAPNAPNPGPHRGLTVKTIRARAVADAAVADAVAVAVVAERTDGRRAATVRFPAGPTTNHRPVAGPLRRGITTVLSSPGMSGWKNRRHAQASPLQMVATTTTAIARNRPERVTAMQTGLRDVAADVDGGAAAAADVATVTVMSAPGRRQTAKAVNRPPSMPATARPALPTTILMTSRCPLVMACDRPPGREPTPVGPMRLGMTAVSRPARPVPTIASLVNRVAVAVAVAAAAKAGVAMPAAPPHLQRAAARGLHHAVRAKAVRVKKAAGVDGVAAGPRETRVVPRLRSIVVAAMNLRPWQADARRMTRAWSSSGSRTPAMTAAAVTNVIRRTTMTASLRAASTRCSTCRAGWRRLALSLPVISTPAADPHAGETLVVAGESRGGDSPPRGGSSDRPRDSRRGGRSGNQR